MFRLIVVFLIACFAGLFVQSTMAHATAPTAAAPDIIMVLVVIIALRFRNVPAIIGAFCLGLLSDFASGQFVGPNAAAAVVVFAMVGAIAARVYADRSLALMLIVFVCSFAKTLTVVLMYSVYLDDYIAQVLRGPVLRLAAMEALFSALIAPVVLKLLSLGRPFRRLARTGSSSSYNWSD